MAGYLYECRECGPWEVRRPIGTAEPTATCPACGALGGRRYTAPLLSRSPKAMSMVRAREEASRDSPAVTTRVPGAVGRPAPRDPRWSALPRP
jgi:putative FmdB family regulatory protein